MPYARSPAAAIVVAAGSGSRLGHPVPKALVPVGGVPMVVRAVDAMFDGGCARVVVVAPGAHLEQFRALFADRAPRVMVVVGGQRRQDSVRLGLARVGDTAVVLVHDAARPLVPSRVVEDVARKVAEGASIVVPVMPVVDTIRRLEAKGSGVVDRSLLRAVQTPQGFSAQVLRRAHHWLDAEGAVVTDDAAACESLGEHVTLVHGDRMAMKITEPFDLVVAEAIVATRE